MGIIVTTANKAFYEGINLIERYTLDVRCCAGDWNSENWKNEQPFYDANTPVRDYTKLTIPEKHGERLIVSGTDRQPRDLEISLYLLI